MAYDKVVDSSKLNSAMTATANAIRGKTGGTSQIAWNESTGFASAVNSIEATEAENLTDVLDSQETKLNELLTILDGKAAGGGGVSVEGIPAGYAKVDFIQFNGNECVDTGLMGNQDTEIKVVFTREATNSLYLCGVASEDNTKSITIYVGGYWRFGSKSVTKAAYVGANNGLVYTGLVDKTQLTVTNNKTSISSVGTFETIGTIIFGGGRLSDGTVEAQYVGKAFVWEVRQSGVLVQKLIPLVNANGEYRLYDTVTKTFFDSMTNTPLSGGNY